MAPMQSKIWTKQCTKWWSKT